MKRLSLRTSIEFSSFETLKEFLVNNGDKIEISKISAQSAYIMGMEFWKEFENEIAHLAPEILLYTISNNDLKACDFFLEKIDSVPKIRYGSRELLVFDKDMKVVKSFYVRGETDPLVICVHAKKFLGIGQEIVERIESFYGPRDYTNSLHFIESHLYNFEEDIIPILRNMVDKGGQIEMKTWLLRLSDYEDRFDCQVIYDFLIEKGLTIECFKPNKFVDMPDGYYGLEDECEKECCEEEESFIRIITE